MTPRDLQKWREKHELTQQQAGVWAGSSVRHAARSWRRYELGERKIPRHVIQWVKRNKPFTRGDRRAINDIIAIEQ